MAVGFFSHWDIASGQESLHSHTHGAAIAFQVNSSVQITHRVEESRNRSTIFNRNMLQLWLFSGRCSHCLHCFNFVMNMLRLSIIEWSAIVCDRTNSKSRFSSYCQLVHETDTVFAAVCKWHGADHGAPLHTRTSYTTLKHMQSFSARSKSKLSRCRLASGVGIACSRVIQHMKKSQSRNYPSSTHSAQFRWKLNDFSLVFCFSPKILII